MLVLEKGHWYLLRTSKEGVTPATNAIALIQRIYNNGTCVCSSVAVIRNDDTSLELNNQVVERDITYDISQVVEELSPPVVAMCLAGSGIDMSDF